MVHIYPVKFIDNSKFVFFGVPYRCTNNEYHPACRLTSLLKIQKFVICDTLNKVINDLNSISYVIRSRGELANR
jgi:hypothetical protein